ncbi:MAG: TrkH family potassium uptake protein, partial [Paracoccus sp. (in: a-proteobacteria)]|nr:TrkH family potassium uptake protein [Paracoccus sp. (in: a-proteobacteria)]
MLARLPLILILSGIGALAMMVPAAYAAVMDEHEIARNFFYSGLLFLILSGMLGLAVSANPPAPRGRMMLLSM